VTRLLPRLEQGDAALVVGCDAAPLAYLLAAHDVEVIFTGSDMTFVDQVESRVAEEALGHYCSTYVAPTSQCWPVCAERVQIVAIDTATLEAESARSRRIVIERLIERTSSGGVHLIMPSARALAPDAFLSHYAEWTREEPGTEKRRPAKSLGVLLCKPPEVAEPGESFHSRDVPA
jgi:hypothetical protein